MRCLHKTLVQPEEYLLALRPSLTCNMRRIIRSCSQEVVQALHMLLTKNQTPADTVRRHYGELTVNSVGRHLLPFHACQRLRGMGRECMYFYEVQWPAWSLV